jgi:hypothetical protein
MLFLQKDWYKNFSQVIYQSLPPFFQTYFDFVFFRGIHHFLVSTSTDPQLSNHKLVDEAGSVFSLLVLRQFPWKNIQDPTSHGDSSTMFHP